MHIYKHTSLTCIPSLSKMQYRKGSVLMCMDMYMLQCLRRKKTERAGKETVSKCSLEAFFLQYFSIIETIVTTVAILISGLVSQGVS